MELKATTIGKHLARHPYHSIKMLPAGVAMVGDKHEYIIPFNELLSVSCRRGVVWGELELLLPADKVVRLHGTDWPETRDFYQHFKLIWQAWSREMAEVTLHVLQDLAKEINNRVNLGWLSCQTLQQVQQLIQQALAAIPLPEARLSEFSDCANLWNSLKLWLEEGGSYREKINQQWVKRQVEQDSEFFNSLEQTPLNLSQRLAILNGEQDVLVLAGAGSGKTSVLVARSTWLIVKEQVDPSKILLLAFGKDAATELNQRLPESVKADGATAVTFHALARQIICNVSNKSPKISQLETDKPTRQKLLAECWQQQCQAKKSQADAWREWLSEALSMAIEDNDFWNDKKILARLLPKLESWLALIRMHGGTLKALVEEAGDEQRPLLSKRIKLMAPLLKAWKAYLKQEASVDFSGLIEQACDLLEKGRFISPWKHILVDEFQDISPQRMKLIELLRKQNDYVHLYAVGDDWQAIYRFSGSDMAITTQFKQRFPSGAVCYLDKTYRFNQRIGEVASKFVQANPQQLAKDLNSLTKGSKKAIQLLSEEKLEALINKMSGYVNQDEEILILGRYHHSRPDLLEKANTRWPNVNIRYQTIHASKGQQADYVIILGLTADNEGIPAVVAEGIIEQVLLPQQEGFAHAEERRLLYVAITRAKHEVWLMYNTKQPSVFVEELKQLGVRQLTRP